MSLNFTSIGSGVGKLIGGLQATPAAGIGALIGAGFGMMVDIYSSYKNREDELKYQIKELNHNRQKRNDYIKRLNDSISTTASTINRRYGDGAFEAIRALYQKQNTVAGGLNDLRIGTTNTNDVVGKKKTAQKVAGLKDKELEYTDNTYVDYNTSRLELDMSKATQQEYDNIYSIFANSDALKNELGLYKTQFDNILSNAFGMNTNRITEARGALESYGAQMEMTNLSGSQSIGNAQAMAGASGIRGTGTGSASVKLQQLQYDLNEAYTAIQIDNYIKNALIEMENTSKSSIQSAYEVREKENSAYAGLLNNIIDTVDHEFNEKQIEGAYEVNDMNYSLDSLEENIEDLNDDNFFEVVFGL